VTAAPRLSRLEHVVLGVLTNQPRHGYALKQRLSPGLPRERMINDGVLYPLLKRLQKRGLIEVVDDGDDPRGRTVYGATAAGTAAFRAWLLGDADEGGDLSYDLFVGQPLVKLLFAGQLTDAQRQEKIAALIAAAHVRLDALRAVEASPPPGGWTDVGRALLDIGLAQQEVAVARLEELANA
jgi:DNA-binding PadR family transcriptional regulator